MAVKIADTLKALSNTFPVAECVDIDVNIKGTTKRLQKAIDDGEIGGSDSTWKGTKEEWGALSPEEKGKYEVVYFTDDYDGSGIGGIDSSWKGTLEEWEALSPEEKGKYEIIYFTNDYDDSGIGGSDSSWRGTLEEWEALSTEEKGKYEMVYFTDDYDDSGIGGSDPIWKGTKEDWEALDTTEKQKYEVIYFTDDYNDAGLIDDTNVSSKTTYSSGKIENSLNNKANTTDLTAHTDNADIHITPAEREKWNKVIDKIDKTSIITAKNNSATDDEVYSAKTVNANLGEIIGDGVVKNAIVKDNNGVVIYTLKNGVCYVSVSMLDNGISGVDPTVELKKQYISGLPTPLFPVCVTLMSDGFPVGNLFNESDGTWSFHRGIDRYAGHGSFSYPIAKS